MSKKIGMHGISSVQKILVVILILVLGSILALSYVMENTTLNTSTNTSQTSTSQLTSQTSQSISTVSSGTEDTVTITTTVTASTTITSTIVVSMANVSYHSYPNVAYCNLDGVTWNLTVWIPTTIYDVTGSVAPLVILVHGGGWLNNSESPQPIPYDIWTVENVPQLLLDNGFVVMNMGYYLPSGGNSTTPTGPNGYPENIQDVTCAVQYMRANAALYHVNPNEIGLLGDSAGGHLASLEALAAVNSVFNSPEYPGVSATVQAVVDDFGPANLTDPSFTQDHTVDCFSEWCINLLDYVFGANKNASNLFAASPVNHVSSMAPPFLIQQGDNDTTVLPIQSEQLYTALVNSGVNAQLQMVQCAGHNFQLAKGCTTLSPSEDQLAVQAVAFLISKLG
jgi:acetyl esterase/lipase